jgi:hypothetical protein
VTIATLSLTLSIGFPFRTEIGAFAELSDFRSQRRDFTPVAVRDQQDCEWFHGKLSSS